MKRTESTRRLIRGYVRQASPFIDRSSLPVGRRYRREFTCEALLMNGPASAKARSSRKTLFIALAWNLVRRQDFLPSFFFFYFLNERDTNFINLKLYYVDLKRGNLYMRPRWYPFFLSFSNISDNPFRKSCLEDYLGRKISAELNLNSIERNEPLSLRKNVDEISINIFRIAEIYQFAVRSNELNRNRLIIFLL